MAGDPGRDAAMSRGNLSFAEERGFARAVAEPADLPAPEFAWTSAALGDPTVDLEDPEDA